MNTSAWSLKPLQVVLAGGSADRFSDKSKQDPLCPTTSPTLDKFGQLRKTLNYSAWSLKPLQVVLAGGAVDGPTDKSKQDHLACHLTNRSNFCLRLIYIHIT